MARRYVMIVRMLFSPSKSRVPLFSQKTLYEGALGIGICLLILLGLSGYDAARWHVTAKRWPVVQAGIDARQSCAEGRRSGICPYILEYSYQGNTYYQTAELNRLEVNQRLEALQPGERTESVTVPIKINPDDPEEIVVPPQSLDRLAVAPFVGLIFVIFIVLGIHLKKRYGKEEGNANTK